MRWQKVLLLVAAVALAVPQEAAAVRVLKKRLLLNYHIDWCPFREQLLLSFVADSPEATLILTADVGEGDTSLKVNEDTPSNTHIDNIAVVEKGALARDFRGAAGVECEGEPTFIFSNGTSSGVVLLETFADADSWTLTHAEHTTSRSAPDSPAFPDQGTNTGSLEMSPRGDEPATATIQLQGLIPGKEYVISGWIDLGDLVVEVESPTPTAFYLNDGRFKVEALWGSDDKRATARKLSENALALALSNGKQFEVLVGSVSRCTRSGGGTYWVSVGGTTSQPLEITVTDQVTGISKTFTNGNQRLKAVVDKTTFRCQ